MRKVAEKRMTTAQRLSKAALSVNGCVEARAGKCGGIPVLKGTRFTIAQLFGELAEGESIDSLVADFDLDREQLSTLLHALAVCMDVRRLDDPPLAVPDEAG